MKTKSNSPKPVVESTKYEQIFELGDIIQIWRYDRKLGRNAYEVENVYKGEPKYNKLKKDLK